MVRTNGVEYTVETEKDNQSFNSGEGNIIVNNENDTTESVPNGDESTENNQGTTQVDKSEQTVYVSQTGKKYHSDIYCSRLYTSNEIYEMTLSEAKSKGIEACSKCWQ